MNVGPDKSGPGTFEHHKGLSDRAASLLRQASVVDATRLVATDCLLSDLHHSLHLHEQCPECGYRFADIG